MIKNFLNLSRILLTVSFLTAIVFTASCGTARNKIAAAEPPNESENKQRLTTPETNIKGKPTPDTLPNDQEDLSKAKTITYCELIGNPAKYDHQIVRVRAIYFSGFEKIYLYDDHCQIGEPPTAPPEVPAQTWAEQDRSFISKGDSDEAKLNRQISGFERKDITAIGRFYSTNEQSDANAPDIFGHMNCCRFQFLIMRVENVIDSGVKSAKFLNDYEKPVKYAALQKLDFADFTLEFRNNPNRPGSVSTPSQMLPAYGFKISSKDEEVMVWENEDESGALLFKIGGARYQLETDKTDKSGRLAKNELIVRKL